MPRIELQVTQTTAAAQQVLRALNEKLPEQWDVIGEDGKSYITFPQGQDAESVRAAARLYLAELGGEDVGITVL